VSERLTLAASTGLPFLLLAFHVAMGVTGLATGYMAITARKGGTWHRRSGTIFVCAMIAMGLSAVGIGMYERKADIAGGAQTAYLVFTAWTTVRPVAGVGRRANIALMMFIFVVAAAGFARGFEALERPGNQIEGVPAGMLFFLSTVFLLAAIGDARMIRAGTIQGTRRLARHLWRMCFGLFIASGSFAAQLVKMKFIPDWMRSLTVILVLSAAPIIVLLYWMWRIRLRQNLRGLMTAKPIEAGQPA
jgi:uncharacterized membrane protein